ncbi:MAG: hypothetical protein OXC37_05675 [Bdellovibrionaceae bacterium]|nr:hypothetical protein [Pseudobdellovibrionaceae bacterium]
MLFNIQKSIIFILAFPIAVFSTRGPDRFAVNKETKQCVVFYEVGACSSCDPILNKGWIEKASCPTSYKDLQKELYKIKSISREALKIETIISTEKPELEVGNKIIVNHKTKSCLFGKQNPPEKTDKGWQYYRYNIKEGWVYLKSCPPDYKHYDYEKTHKDEFKTYKEAIGCKKRTVPKCCNEPPLCL